MINRTNLYRHTLGVSLTRLPELRQRLLCPALRNALPRQLNPLNRGSRPPRNNKQCRRVENDKVLDGVVVAQLVVQEEVESRGVFERCSPGDGGDGVKREAEVEGRDGALGDLVVFEVPDLFATKSMLARRTISTKSEPQPT